MTTREEGRKLKPRTLLNDAGQLRVRTPVMDLEGLITPTDLFYVVQHFDIPEPVSPENWSLTVDGEVKRPLDISYDKLRSLTGRTVRTVMECSGSDTEFFGYFKGEKPRPSRTSDGMILSAVDGRTPGSWAIPT